MTNIKFEISDTALEASVNNLIQDMKKHVTPVSPISDEASQIKKKLNDVQNACMQTIQSCRNVSALEKKINEEGGYHNYKEAFRSLHGLVASQRNLKLTVIPKLTEAILISSAPEYKSIVETHKSITELKKVSNDFFQLMQSHHTEINNHARSEYAKEHGDVQPTPSSSAQPILSSSLEAKHKVSQGKAAEANRAGGVGVAAQQKNPNAKT